MADGESKRTARAALAVNEMLGGPSRRADAGYVSRMDSLDLAEAEAFESATWIFGCRAPFRTCARTNRPTRATSSSESDSYTGTCTAVIALAAPGALGPVQPNNFIRVQSSTCMGATSAPRRMQRRTMFS